MIQTTIKKLGRPIVCSLTFFSGYCALVKGLGLHKGARVLSYHGIQDHPTNPYAVSTHDFFLQMQHLARYFTPLPLDQLVGQLKNGSAIPPRAIAVTFDDGYRDIYDKAYPILKVFAIPATVFLPVAFVEPAPLRLTAHGLSQTDFLSWEQIQEMLEDNISFASHTLSHSSLTALTVKEAQYELESSKAVIETKTNRPVKGFAYPYGTVRDFNPLVKDLVAAAGYEWAVTGLSGLNDHRADLFALRRTKIERDDSMYIFKKAVRGALDPWILMEKLGKFL